ncbi:MAG: archease [Deltaproteobacteria bacterium]|nr:archease [Deltaproteobacteria bacterium]MBW2306223.1 archease [Deltaproteobacteria bacterium]
MPYHYLEDVATADVAFEARGETLEELFTAAVDATTNVMVRNLSGVRERVEKSIRVSSDALDLLLVELLQEVIYWKDVERLLLRVKDIILHEDNGRYSLEARAVGEELDPARHELIVDVKAVTLHRLKVEKTERGWEAAVILDI